MLDTVVVDVIISGRPLPSDPISNIRWNMDINLFYLYDTFMI